MSLLDIIFTTILAWIVVYYLAIRFGKKYFAPYGPALLLKTSIGIRTIERVSKNKFWDYFLSAFYYIIPILGFFTIILLVWEAVLVLSIPKSEALPLKYILALPGINPAIPILYGIIGLIVAVGLHEASHGIAARRFNIKVKSTGLLWLVIPIGAFVEPDEDEVKQRDPKTRAKIFAAGPAMNIIIAIITILAAISIANYITPVPGAVVYGSINPSFQPGEIIQSINNVNITNYSQIFSLSLTPGQMVNVTVLSHNPNIQINGIKLSASNYINVNGVKYYVLDIKTFYGLYITGLIKNSPAYNSTIKVGSILISLNGQYIDNYSNFLKVFYKYKPGNVVTLTTMFNGKLNNYTVTLGSRYNYLLSQGVTPSPGDKNLPYLGVYLDPLGLEFFDQYSYLNLIRNPLNQGILGLFIYVGLPLHFEMPLPDALMYSYASSPYLWTLEETFYWLFWLNFALGLTNVLPIVPLDGGYVLMNIPALNKNEKLRNYIVATVSLIILFLIMWQIIIPRL